MALQEYFGRFYTTALQVTVTKGANVANITVAAGNYFIAGYTAEATNQLIEEIESQMQAATGFSGADTIVYDHSTGLVTFTFDASSTITWTTASLKTTLGFGSTDTSVAATSFTGDVQPRYIWRPSRAPSEYPTNLSRFWGVGSTTITGRSRDGFAWAVEGNKFYEANISYKYLSESETVQTSTTDVYDNFEAFYEDVCHAGYPIRIFPDRTAYGSTDYVTGQFNNGDSLGLLSEFAVRNLDSYNGLWDVTLPLRKYTGS